MTHTELMRRLIPPRAVVLGPMAGITEAPFRAICKRMGASLTYTEMVSAKGLHYNPDAPIAQSLLTFASEEVPCVVQVFGSDPEIMAAQGARIVAKYGDSVACLDVNMGCPVTKVVARGEGSALMRDTTTAVAIVERMVQECGRPITAKFRSGWDADSVNAVEFARALEAAGAAALAVHGRTRDQFYRGAADWSVIAAVKAAVDIPVIGSGDVFSADDVLRMFERTGVDAVMIARGAQGNPWIFREARAVLDTGAACPPPSALERIEMAREHAAALVDFAGENAFTRMRKHVSWYIYDMPGAARVRERANECRSYREMDDMLEAYSVYVTETLDE